MAIWAWRLPPRLHPNHFVPDFVPIFFPNHIVTDFVPVFVPNSDFLPAEMKKLKPRVSVRLNRILQSMQCTCPHRRQDLWLLRGAARRSCSQCSLLTRRSISSFKFPTPLITTIAYDYCTSSFPTRTESS